MFTVDRHDLISLYFNLDDAIKNGERRIKELREHIYDLSFYTRNEPTSEGDLIVKAFRVENEVARFVDCAAEIQTRIAINHKKIRYFNEALEDMPSEVRKYAIERYKYGMDISYQKDKERLILDEINEIEEAIQHMYGHKPEVRELLTDDDKSNLSFDDYLTILGV